MKQTEHRDTSYTRQHLSHVLRFVSMYAINFHLCSRVIFAQESWRFSCICVVPRCNSYPRPQLQSYCIVATWLYCLRSSNTLDLFLRLLILLQSFNLLYPNLAFVSTKQKLETGLWTFNVLRKSLILRNNSFLSLLNLNKFSKSFAKIGKKLNFGLLYS